MAVPNPVAFKPFSVTFWTTVIYLALLIPLIIVHETVPSPPHSPTLYSGINLTDAWSDLATLTRAYHPYNSRNNDDVRNWLLFRIGEIVKRNEVDASQVVIFNDTITNVTLTHPARLPKTEQYPGRHPEGAGTYFEGNNIMVYIRGKDDPQRDWWFDIDGYIRADKVIGKGGVLVNAHFDSVSSGYGATDDGMGVITILQLINYFTAPGNQPQRGIVALLNNNEEDGLHGARVFGYSSLMPFCHTFLNLEGAGAGGRANLFRATDLEVINAYKGTEHPFGTVMSSDAWSTKAIRSGTDYEVFKDVYGMRGMDVAFYRPRARYHTNQDDIRHASRASLWHMLSSSLHTVKGLSGDTGSTFIGNRRDRNPRKVSNGAGTDGVWFDIFGKGFAMFGLRPMFAWSLTLLIVSPLILILFTYVLVKRDKYYFFSSRKSPYEGSVLDSVVLGGRKGMFRFLLAFVVSVALVVGSAYLLRKINPLVIYSHEYTVWSMMMSLFYFAFWSIMASANFARPSALHRGYVILWLFIITWALLVVTTVYEDRFRVAAGYVFVFLHSAVFLSAVITVCEQFALPTKTAFAQKAHDEHQAHDHMDAVPHADDLIEHSSMGGGANDVGDDEGNSDEASETSPLVGGNSRDSTGTTFGTIYRRSISAIKDKSKATEDQRHESFGYEQEWSKKLPSWVWFLQFLLLGPFLLILFGQAGLELVASVNQTGADGSSLLLPYLLVAFFTIMTLLPLTPFVHRITHHIPVLLLVVFVATLIYNLVVFPFSAESRYKVYFRQTIDLDSGVSTIKYTGIDEYVRQAIAELPSALGKNVTCESSNPEQAYFVACSYDGSKVSPAVARGNYTDWIALNITRPKAPNQARFKINALETRTCGLRFNKAISSFQVVGGNSQDDRFGDWPEGGVKSILLYRREWDKPFTVDVEWDARNAESGLRGLVYCDWDDATKGKIPAYDEGLQYAPDWVALTKESWGLLHGSKAFKV
ncbi:uncharacterized protein BCR38DRAFT_479891 [Pseudomassariella vexata]|uniref:Peptide hydrolase n=1 Tax=Pseudomassariella vexata TaxID=1141098 RepID=A0A1Y2EKM0_9PEZI|nr:uncharacterized protein BCR38DRAFT_479891 [Pseudomassariella vexata]ORY71395.1 hypothetical protein BCR38DRAFT_479891 [Pseudomassariella vexata]